jgi:DNA-binding transcriptional LysR family regulator
VQALSHKLEGEIRLGASTIPGEYLLPRYLGLLQQRYPGLRVKLEIGDSRGIASQVAEGKLELGIIGAPLNSRVLQLELLYNDSLVVVVPKNHPYAGRQTITLQEFLQEPLIAREVGSGTRTAIEARLSAAGISAGKLQIRLELGSNETVLNAVAQGLGISLVSRLAAEARERGGEITCLNISDLPLERGLYLATRKSPPLKWNLTVVSDFLKQAVQDDQTLAGQG